MKTIKLIVGFILAVASATVWGSQNGLTMTWDRALSCPPEWTAYEMALAEVEVLPENWSKTKVVYASDYGQKLEEKVEEPTPYFEATFSTRRGVEPSDSYSGVGVYAEIPFGTDGYSVWFSGYKDPAFTGNYLGIAKKIGNWQVGLGGGNVHYDELRHTVVNPWVYYSSEDWDAYLHAEHYSRETEKPWWYKGYIERKFGSIGVGAYGEKDMGVGPRLSYKLNDHVKVWATIPMWQQPGAGRMKFFINVVLSF
jgi:hypothetical protein